MNLKLDTTQNDGLTRITVEGAVTSHDLNTDSGNPLHHLLGEGWASKRVLLDLGHTDYMDSMAIGWLLGTHKEISRQGGKLVLHSISPKVKQLLELLNINKLLSVAPDATAAAGLAQKEQA